MFHLAPPLCAGSGVRICRPDCVRSFQFVMCFGLPGRTSKTTADVATMPPSVLRCPVVRDEPGVLDRLHVGVERQRHDVGREPVHDVLRLRRAAAERRREDDLLAVVLVGPVSLERRDELAVDVVDVAVRGERDDRAIGRRAGAAAAARGCAVATAVGAARGERDEDGGQREAEDPLETG